MKKNRIILTGASGMVGKNILEHPSCQQTIIFTPSSSELNLLEYSNTFEYLFDKQPDLIIHAAGRVGGIQANIKHPVDFLVQNWIMGQNILLAAREVNIKCVLNLGSSCMYPRNIEGSLSEDLILKGELEPTNEGYALAKIATARLGDYINREDSSFQYKTLIPCNIYGRWDKFDPERSHLIPAIIYKITKAVQNQQDIVDIWGDGKSRREFMYAGDFADAVWWAIDNFELLPTYLNVGLGHDYSINDYYETVKILLEYEGGFMHDLNKPSGMRQKLEDVSRIHTLGWKANTSLKEGLRRTMEFYQKEWPGDDR